MIINKSCKGIGILRTMDHFLQEKQLQNLYSSFIKSYTKNGNIAWGGTTKTNIAKINRSLRKAIRIKIFKGKRETVQPLSQYSSSQPKQKTFMCKIHAKISI